MRLLDQAKAHPIQQSVLLTVVIQIPREALEIPSKWHCSWQQQICTICELIIFTLYILGVHLKSNTFSTFSFNLHTMCPFPVSTTRWSQSSEFLWHFSPLPWNQYQQPTLITECERWIEVNLVAQLGSQIHLRQLPLELLQKVIRSPRSEGRAILCSIKGCFEEANLDEGLINRSLKGSAV